MRKKIVLIGAGSAAFTQGLVADLILSPDLEGCELGLVDPWKRLKASPGG